jgi:MoeA N-terminal region (domain I and II)
VLSVAEAARAVLAKLPRLHVERVAIDDARGRVLAENIVATRALPGFDNSAMDGLGAIHFVTNLTGEERIFRRRRKELGPMTEGKTRLSATCRDYGDAQRPTAWLGW